MITARNQRTARSSRKQARIDLRSKQAAVLRWTANQVAAGKWLHVAAHEVLPYCRTARNVASKLLAHNGKI